VLLLNAGNRNAQARVVGGWEHATLVLVAIEAIEQCSRAQASLMHVSSRAFVRARACVCALKDSSVSVRAPTRADGDSVVLLPRTILSRRCSR
jgi:hypothetical protein